MGEITIKDIARICGVGVSTVSRALNNHPDIRPETREQIQNVIAQYGYIPNNSARNLKRIESNAIAVLVRGVTNPLFNDIIKVLNFQLKRHKWTMILQQVDYEEDEVAVALELIKEKRLKGIIFLGFNYYHPEGQIDKISVPFILGTIGSIYGDEDSAKYSHVTVDDMAESYKMTDYLIKKGHREIAILSAEGEASSMGKLRMAGYMKALADNGIAYNPNLRYSYSEGVEHYSMTDGYLATQRLLASGEHFTAIYATTDIIAAGAYRALFEAGLKIPDDVSVVGFDGIEIGDYIRPKLTTNLQPAKKMAEKIFEQLYDLVNENCGNKNIIFKGELLEKESVYDLNQK